MRYVGRIFRPPSEAHSLIVQSTIGCSHNKCDFCDMYKEKLFRIREIQSVLDDLTEARQKYRSVWRIFIADGDALVRTTEDWIKILEHIRAFFPECERVSSYGTPRSVLNKSNEDLELLHSLGLYMIYMGLESGSDAVLESINKGETVDEIVDAGIKIKESGIKASVTVISGLGGTGLWEDHAIKTSKALSLIKPDYIGLLTLMLVEGTPLYERNARGEFEVPNPMEIAAETLLMLSNIDSEGSVFRSNHASNYLSLGGTLNKDIETMKTVLKEALEGKVVYKNEWLRGL
ncbi:MAG: radical SAM protein [Defluviitaleaceae bacterium]|nr:radical SAM protein [Defluviitaleaceae bacterium]